MFTDRAVTKMSSEPVAMRPIVDRMTHAYENITSYPEIFPLSALIACNTMNWPGGAAIYLSHKFHHWLMLYTLGQYIVNVQSSMASEGFLSIFKFGIGNKTMLFWVSVDIPVFIQYVESSEALNFHLFFM